MKQSKSKKLRCRKKIDRWDGIPPHLKREISVKNDLFKDFKQVSNPLDEDYE